MVYQISQVIINFHRSIIIPSISNGICEINNILRSDDVLHTLEAFKSMGVRIEEDRKN